MAIAKQGINGPFSGKVGSVIGYQLNGQPVMRSVGRRIKPFSALELLNQAKMKAVSKFLGPINPIVKFGFRREAPPGSRVGPFQLAQSYVRKNAIEVDDEQQPFIDPAKVLISRGALEPPLNCTVQREENQLTLRWDWSGHSNGSDRLMVLLYDGNLFRYFHEMGAMRSKREEVLELDALRFQKKPIHVYAAFLDTMFDKISDSVYCGVLE